MTNAHVTSSFDKLLIRKPILLLWLWVAVVFAVYLRVLSPYIESVLLLLLDLLAGGS